jgi:hypothetical protein
MQNDDRSGGASGGREASEQRQPQRDVQPRSGTSKKLKKQLPLHDSGFQHSDSAAAGPWPAAGRSRLPAQSRQTTRHMSKTQVNSSRDGKV